MWFRLASHLHMPLQDVQERTTSSEFAEWILYLEQDMGVPGKAEYYLAQVAAEVRRSFVKNPRTVNPEDFILKFRGVRRAPRQSLRELNQRMEMSKAFWLRVTGVKSE